MFEILLEKTVGTPDEKTRVSTVKHVASGGKPTGSKLASKLAQAELLAKLGSAFEELDGRHLAMKMTDATFNQLGLSPFDSDKGDFLVVDPHGHPSRDRHARAWWGSTVQASRVTRQAECWQRFRRVLAQR